MKKHRLFYEESPLNGKKFNIFRKDEKDMESKVTTKKPVQKHNDKKKTTLSVYTYMNFKQFGLAVRIENGIKITVLLFETHIKFEKR